MLYSFDVLIGDSWTLDIEAKTLEQAQAFAEGFEGVEVRPGDGWQWAEGVRSAIRGEVSRVVECAEAVVDCALCGVSVLHRSACWSMATPYCEGCWLSQSFDPAEAVGLSELVERVRVQTSDLLNLCLRLGTVVELGQFVTGSASDLRSVEGWVESVEVEASALRSALLEVVDWYATT